MAATGVGAGDFIMATVAGVSYGWALMWAIVAGAIIKLVLTEGVGRWYLATGKTFLKGWNSLGKVATYYFGAYLILFGIIYGAAIPAVSALVLTAIFPGSPFWLWAISSSLAGFILIWFGKYALLEKAMLLLIGVMFITVIGSAILILFNLQDVSYSFAPSIPRGSFIQVLGIIGGVGGTLALVCYSYWLHEKGWRGSKWIPMMRFDITAAYIITGLFAVAVMVIAAELLFGSGTSISGNEGLIGLADSYGERFGSTARLIFLVGVWSAVFTSIIGPWHGVSYLFADFVRIVRNNDKEEAITTEPVPEKDKFFRLYLVWLTFPPMLLLFLGKPVALVLTYGILSAIFMPILSVGLLFLLNSKRVRSKYRSGIINNSLLVLIVLLFAYLGSLELYQMIMA